MEVLALHVLEGVEVAGRGMTGLGAGDVEADHAGIPPTHGQLRDLEATSSRPHRRQQRVDGEARAGRDPPETLEDGVDDFVECQPGIEMLLGREAHLRVDHTVGGEIFRALGRHSHDGVALLHHAHRVGEGLEVQDEVVAPGAPMEPA